MVRRCVAPWVRWLLVVSVWLGCGSLAQAYRERGRPSALETRVIATLKLLAGYSRLGGAERAEAVARFSREVKLLAESLPANPRGHNQKELAKAVTAARERVEKGIENDSAIHLAALPLVASVRRVKDGLPYDTAQTAQHRRKLERTFPAGFAKLTELQRTAASLYEEARQAYLAELNLPENASRRNSFRFRNRALQAAQRRVGYDVAFRAVTRYQAELVRTIPGYRQQVLLESLASKLDWRSDTDPARHHELESILSEGEFWR